MEYQDQISMIIDDAEDVFDGASETGDSSSSASPISDPRSDCNQLFDLFSANGMIMVREEAKDHRVIKSKFVTGLNQHAKHTNIVAIHKNIVSTLPMIARFIAFRSAMVAARRRRGDSNVKFGWYAGSKEEIHQIISHGFGRCNGQSHGVGVCLSTTQFLLDGLPSSTADENGLRHMLVCTVVMGKMESIPAGSKQTYPSSAEFDSGADNLEAPRKLVVWSAYMNSHIFPAYLVSFKAPRLCGVSTSNTSASELSKYLGRKVSMNAMFPILVNALGTAKGDLISQGMERFRKGELTREEMIRHLREIVGNDRLLVLTVKACIDEACGKCIKQEG